MPESTPQNLAVVSALCDIGVNLGHRRFDKDRHAVVERAGVAGVRMLVLTGTSISSSQKSLKLAERYGVSCTAGVHPHDAAAFAKDPTGLDALRALHTHSEVKAVGECGLDFDRDFSPRDVQESVFAQQLELAVTLGKPVFLHERAAHSRFVAILGRYPSLLSRAVVHCFTGSEAELGAYLELGVSIGITGWVCDERRGQHLLPLLAQIPAGRLMLETDAPFLTPRDLRPKPRGGRNEPAFLVHIAKRVAEARGESFQDLAAHTTEAARSFFRLD